MKKKNIHPVELGSSIYGKKRSTSKKVSPIHKSVSKKDLIKVYNKFYKSQVNALYRAIHTD